MDEDAKKLACTPEVRALEVEKAIWREVDAGRIVLTHGTYGMRGAQPCHACAIGSAAFALCGIDVSAYDRPQHSDLRKALRAKGAMTMDEMVNLESGFEYGVTVNCDPFYQLGMRLARGERPAS